MTDDEAIRQDGILAANDNAGGAASVPLGENLDKVVLSIARLMGRQMAREEFERMRAATANDNQQSACQGCTQEDHSGDDGN
ncbi:hypothetical protein LQT97_13255 [Brucella pseudogrignonensis]|uniref:hypothetical protein n=1 Tax=Brucella pseudogrignonensis TaxID=419475 RepID=UPI001E407D80|nr:hypothetical protein [Brucella pseudogrignonensis]MCD4512197.1 hypothetical protein [Brucella pseudogrignonensis]